MSEAEKYKGLEWITVKRATPIMFEPIFGESSNYVSEQHHIEETSFLIDKVRELAAKIDILNVNLRVYTHAAESQRKQYYDDRDFLPYEEDDR